MASTGAAHRQHARCRIRIARTIGSATAPSQRQGADGDPRTPVNGGQPRESVVMARAGCRDPRMLIPPTISAALQSLRRPSGSGPARTYPPNENRCHPSGIGDAVARPQRVAVLDPASARARDRRERLQDEPNSPTGRVSWHSVGSPAFGEADQERSIRRPQLTHGRAGT